MAITAEKFVELTNAEICGDRIITRLGERIALGDMYGGVFTLNEAGQARMAEIEELGVRAASKVAKEAKDISDAEAELKAAEDAAAASIIANTPATMPV